MNSHFYSLKKKRKKKKYLKKKVYSLFRDVLGNFYLVKRFLIFTFGWITYNRYHGFNRLKLKGTENLKKLPDNKVLFVSNHQTYFADVFAMFHVFCSVKNGFINTIKNPIYLFNPKVNLYYVADKKTMNNGFLGKLLTYSGAVTVKRTWKGKKNNDNNGRLLYEINRMGKAINDGWLITFPQGTTKKFAPGRRGIVHVIRKYKPIVVPIVLDGFKKSFDKKGIKIIRKEIFQKMQFKKPIKLDFKKDTTEKIMNKIMDSIEQSNKYK
ncbi:lysophospholipid acyltransferase family protein [Blattabacterium cuenoti]|uniref:lysophospholipid acyltransferase family protein n=1 Tax=Blattabacterium cuenoti TaxID=1653831 RepID=UPI00163C8317|nr:lysophospholipid acyltransferase family protein [Blattabacterium cuenoti]